MHVCMHTYRHTDIHTCMHTYMHTCIHACMYTYMYVYMYVLANLHPYIKTHMHTCIHTCIHKQSTHMANSMVWHAFSCQIASTKWSTKQTNHWFDKRFHFKCHQDIEQKNYWFGIMFHDTWHQTIKQQLNRIDELTCLFLSNDTPKKNNEKHNDLTCFFLVTYQHQIKHISKNRCLSEFMFDMIFTSSRTNISNKRKTNQNCATTHQLTWKLMSIKDVFWSEYSSFGMAFSRQICINKKNNVLAWNIMSNGIIRQTICIRHQTVCIYVSNYRGKTKQKIYIYVYIYIYRERNIYIYISSNRLYLCL